MLIARVRRTLLDRALIPRAVRVLCACSGGPDSAALLYVLARLGQELGFELEAASVDHGLRLEAARDVAIAGRQAGQLGVPFHSLAVSVTAEGGSIQARARVARYAALAQLAQRIGATRIAVGHTLDDQAETVLARLLRGAGVRGLAAIDPRRADGVVRPLIDCERALVHALAREQFSEIAWDASNLDPRFERVRIRTHVLPALQSEDLAAVRHLAELADEARSWAEQLDRQAERVLRRAQLDTKTLRISALAEQPAGLRRAVLRLWVRRVLGTHPGRAELAQLERTLVQGRGEVWLSAAHSVRAEGRERLCVRPRIGEKG